MKYFSVTLIALIIHVQFSTAQDSATTYRLFNYYYQQSIEKLKELYGIRQADFACTIDKNTNYGNEVKSFISKYGQMADKIGAMFYSHTNDTLRIWLIAHNKLYYHAQPVTEIALIENEFNLRNALKVTSRSKKRAVLRYSEIEEEPAPAPVISLADAIQSATNLLIPVPFRQTLLSLTHLYIIPEFNVGQFPFHLLQPFDNKTYLADKLSFSFIPHLCNLGMFTRDNATMIGTKTKLSTYAPLVIGNPAFSKKTGYKLSSLNGAEEEANAIAGVLGTKAIIKDEATLDTIKYLAPKSDFLYFATHGYFDFEKIMDGSFLAFAPGRYKPSGLWSSRDIQQTKLKAKMAILSACQTGYGKVVPGGFIGLARAFYKAGVDFTIMSLWSVDDQKTKDFMLIYMEELKKPSLFFPAQPLQKAIIRFKEKNTDPVDWSAFSLFGFTY